MNPLVSVIVPVYNVQDYLDECLASLEGQTLESMEVVLVNDGSTDASGEVMDRYVARNPRKFFRYDKENGGLGDARNYGLERAKGSYVAFIDSDDFVDLDMMERLAAIAQAHDCDIVQGGMMLFDNNDDYTAVERAPFDEEGVIPQQVVVLNATRPVAVSACTKLFRKSLFDNFRFFHIWYEDLALMPVLFSHMQGKFYYLPQPFYHYRWGRQGSIQSQKANLRTLDVLRAQQLILEQGNPQWRQEIEYTVYDHTCRFYQSTPAFSTPTLDFVRKNSARFQNNLLIQEAITTGELVNLLPEENALPKTIHYFRFEELSQTAQACVESWRRHLPGYQLKAWTQQDFDMAENPYLQKAWMSGDIAAAAGYLAFKVLQREGGLYLDTGMLLKAPLNGLDGYQAFLPQAAKELVGWEIMGAAAGHPLLQDILELYCDAVYQPEDFAAIRHGIWQVLVQKYGLAEDRTSTQIVNGHIAVYPPQQLLIDVGEPGNLAELAANGFCPKDNGENPVKHQLQKQYYLERYQKEEPQPEQQDVITGTPREVADAAVVKAGVVGTLGAVARRVGAVVLGRGN